MSAEEHQAQSAVEEGCLNSTVKVIATINGALLLLLLLIRLRRLR